MAPKSARLAVTTGAAIRIDGGPGSSFNFTPTVNVWLGHTLNFTTGTGGQSRLVPANTPVQFEDLEPMISPLSVADANAYGFFVKADTTDGLIDRTLWNVN